MKAPVSVLLVVAALASAALLAKAFVPLLSAAQCKAASVRPDGTIDGCVSQFGDVRASCGAPCRRGEDSISWNQQGPPGDDGIVADANLQCAPGEFITGFSVASGVANITCASTGPPPPPSPTVSPTSSPTVAGCSCAEVGNPANCFDLISHTQSGGSATVYGYAITDGSTGSGLNKNVVLNGIVCATDFNTLNANAPSFLRINLAGSALYTRTSTPFIIDGCDIYVVPSSEVGWIDNSNGISVAFDGRHFSNEIGVTDIRFYSYLPKFPTTFTRDASDNWLFATKPGC
jgi:hypothetical protein